MTRRNPIDKAIDTMSEQEWTVEKKRHEGRGACRRIQTTAENKDNGAKNRCGEQDRGRARTAARASSRASTLATTRSTARTGAGRRPSAERPWPYAQQAQVTFCIRSHDAVIRVYVKRAT